MTAIVLVPLKIDNDFHCTGTPRDHSNYTGYHIALYTHAGAYIVSLGFDRYVYSF